MVYNIERCRKIASLTLSLLLLASGINWTPAIAQGLPSQNLITQNAGELNERNFTWGPALDGSTRTSQINNNSQNVETQQSACTQQQSLNDIPWMEGSDTQTSQNFGILNCLSTASTQTTTPPANQFNARSQTWGPALDGTTQSSSVNDNSAGNIAAQQAACIQLRTINSATWLSNAETSTSPNFGILNCAAALTAQTSTTTTQAPSATTQPTTAAPTTTTQNSACSANIDYVCGKNNITYNNECELNKANAGLAYRGQCIQADCSPDYTPVCINGNETYHNRCMAQRDGKTNITDGECPHVAGEQELRDAENQWKNDDRNRLQREQELKNNFRQSNVDTTSVRKALDLWKSKLDQMRVALDAKDTQKFWSFNQNQDQSQNIYQIVDDAFRNLYSRDRYMNFEKSRIKDAQNVFKDQRRQLSEIKRDLKDTDTSAMEAKINANEKALNGILERYKKLDMNASDLETKLQELEWAMDDMRIHDLFNELNSIRDKGNKVREMKDWRRIVDQDKKNNARDRDQRMKDMVKNGVPENSLAKLREMDKQLQAIRQKMADFVTKAEKSNPEDINNRDFWDMNQDYDWMQGDFWNKAQEIEEPFQQGKEIENLEREYKNNQNMIADMKRECEKVQCKENMKQVISEVAKALSEMRRFMDGKDPRGAWDAQNNVHFIARDFWDGLGSRQQQKDLGFRLKDLTREYDNHLRWMGDLSKNNNTFDKDTIQKLQAMLPEMKKLLDRAQEAYAKEDFETAQRIIGDELDRDWRNRFNDLQQSMNEGQRREGDRMEIDNMKQEMDIFEGQVKESLRKKEITQEKANSCLEMVGKGRNLVNELKGFYERDQIDDLAKDIWKRLEFLGDRADKECGFTHQRDTTNIVRQFFNEDQFNSDFQRKMEAMMEQMANKVLNRLVESMTNQISQVLASMMEKVGEAFQEEIKASLAAVTQIVPENLQERILAAKENTLDQAKNLEELKNNMGLGSNELKALDQLKNELAKSHLYGPSADEIKDAIQAFVDTASSMTPSQREKKIDALFATLRSAEKDSTEALYNDGGLPFKDTGLNDWYTGSVKDVSEEGLVTGYRDANGNLLGVYGPSDKVTIAEITAMSERAGKIQEESGQPDLTIARNHWSRGYVKAAESRGVALFKNLTNLDRPATRAEVMYLILALNGITPDTATGDQFKDVPSNHAYASYILMGRTLGIASGDTDADGTSLNTFRPDAELNRAEAATMIDRALDAISLYQQTQ